MQGSSGGQIPHALAQQGQQAAADSSLDAEDVFDLFGPGPGPRPGATPASAPLAIGPGSGAVPGSRASSLSLPYEDALSHGILTPDASSGPSLLDLDTPPRPAHALPDWEPARAAQGAPYAAAMPAHAPSFSPAPLSWGMPSPLASPATAAPGQGNRIRERSQGNGGVPPIAAMQAGSDAAEPSAGLGLAGDMDARLSFSEDDASASELSSLGGSGSLERLESAGFEDTPQEMGVPQPLAEFQGLHISIAGPQPAPAMLPEHPADAPALSAVAAEAGSMHAGDVSNLSGGSSRRIEHEEAEQRSNVDTGRGLFADDEDDLAAAAAAAASAAGADAAAGAAAAAHHASSGDLVDEWHAQQREGGTFLLEDLPALQAGSVGLGASDLSLSDVEDPEEAPGLDGPLAAQNFAPAHGRMRWEAHTGSQPAAEGSGGVADLDDDEDAGGLGYASTDELEELSDVEAGAAWDVEAPGSVLAEPAAALECIRGGRHDAEALRAATEADVDRLDLPAAEGPLDFQEQQDRCQLQPQQQPRGPSMQPDTVYSEPSPKPAGPQTAELDGHSTALPVPAVTPESALASRSVQPTVPAADAPKMPAAGEQQGDALSQAEALERDLVTGEALNHYWPPPHHLL